MRDQVANNKSIAENNLNETKHRQEKSAKDQSLTNSTSSSTQLEPHKDSPKESGSLNKFRETLKDVLEEITSLEVNTIIVSKIELKSFDVKTFYGDLRYKTDEGLQDIKKSLLKRSAELKKMGSSASQDDLDRYNEDLDIYKKADNDFRDRQNTEDPRKKEQFEMEQVCYQELNSKIAQLKIVKKGDDLIAKDGDMITDSTMIRYFRKLWEIEQSVLNGERIFAQTKFHLDGDSTNRFIEDLFISGRDPMITKLVFDLHNNAVENAQKQWTNLITTCVDLVKALIPYRSN